MKINYLLQKLSVFLCAFASLRREGREANPLGPLRLCDAKDAKLIL